MTMRAIWAASLMLAGFVPAAAKDAQFQRPAYAGAYEPQGVDERGLWMQVDELERSFRDSPLVVQDEELAKYVKSVLCKAVGEDRCSATRVYIVQDKNFNAGMYPNGFMLVHTGLLARVYSEAELATVLAHEFGHFELRHGLNGFAEQRRNSDAMAWVGLAGAAAVQYGSLAQAPFLVGLFRFKRGQETEADMLSASYIRASSYPLRASIVWKRLMEEEDALKEERKLRKVRRYNPGPIDTHPTDLQRFAYFSELEALPGASEGDDGSEAYRAATTRVLPTLFDRRCACRGVARRRADGDARRRWDGRASCVAGISDPNAAGARRRGDENFVGELRWYFFGIRRSWLRPSLSCGARPQVRAGS